MTHTIEHKGVATLAALNEANKAYWDAQKQGNKAAAAQFDATRRRGVLKKVLKKTAEDDSVLVLYPLIMQAVALAL